MKTAVSIPDHIFKKADRLAKKLKKSRSQLYAEAVEEYAAKYSDDAITESWNAMLADPEAADPELDAFVAEAARRTLAQVEW